MTARHEELDPITAQLRSEGERLRRMTARLVLVPIAAGLLVVAGSYWVIDQARKELKGVKDDLAVAEAALDATRSAKEDLDGQIEDLHRAKTMLEEEIAARQALFARYENSLPQEATLLDQGLAAAQAGDDQQALESYGRVLRMNPSNELALTLQGATQARAGKNEDAVASLRRAVSIKPGDAEAWYQLSLALWGVGDKEGAVAAADRSFDLDPAIAKRAYLSPAYRPLRAYREDLGAARSSRNADEAGLKQNALEAARRGRWPDAIASYRSALEINPTNGETWNYLSYALFRSKEFDQAVEAARRATELEPGLAEAHFNLAMALLATGDEESAEQAIEDTFRIDPIWREKAKADPRYAKWRQRRESQVTY